MSRKFVSVILSVIVVISVFCGCDAKDGKNQEGIYGLWYSSQFGEMWIYKFKTDGTCARFSEEVPDMEEYAPFSFDEKSGKMEFSDAKDEEYSAELKEDCFVIKNISFDETYTLYRDRQTALESDPFYLKTDEYLKTIRDKDGWCIKDGILYAYMGDEKKVTVPEGVREIYNSAFSGDSGRGEKLEEVTVPGTVKVIDDGAFSFTNADIIVIEEGVREIGGGAFSDSYMSEIFFPASLKKIGNGIMYTEEGLDGTKIHVPEGSKIAEYFKDDMPYGNAELIEE